MGTINISDQTSRCQVDDSSNSLFILLKSKRLLSISSETPLNTMPICIDTQDLTMSNIKIDLKEEDGKRSEMQSLTLDEIKDLLYLLNGKETVDKDLIITLKGESLLNRIALG